MSEVVVDDIVEVRLRRGIDTVVACRVDTTDGRRPEINAEDILEHLPEAVIDRGDGDRWPVIYRTEPLIPELWLGSQELAGEMQAVQRELGVMPSGQYFTVAARLDAMQTALDRLDSRLDALERRTALL